MHETKFTIAYADLHLEAPRENANYDFALTPKLFSAD
jgi:hypothetical protein